MDVPRAPPRQNRGTSQLDEVVRAHSLIGEKIEEDDGLRPCLPFSCREDIDLKGSPELGEVGGSTSLLVKRTYLTYFIIISLWTVAWTLKIQLDAASTWSASSAGSFLYWVSAKLLIWILPAIWLIRIASRPMRYVFNFANYRQWLLWGGGLGFLIALSGFIPNLLERRALIPTRFSFALINVLLISPFFEEFLLRGAILGNLRQYHSFLASNIIASLMFVGLHIPGWAFMGSLIENITMPVGGAFSIFLVSLVFGYAVKRSDSLMAGIVAHFLNNLA